MSTTQGLARLLSLPPPPSLTLQLKSSEGLNRGAGRHPYSPRTRMGAEKGGVGGLTLLKSRLFTGRPTPLLWAARPIRAARGTMPVFPS